MKRKRVDRLLADAVDMLQMFDETDILRHAEGDDQAKLRRVIQRIEAYRAERGWLPEQAPVATLDPFGTVSSMAVFPPPDWSVWRLAPGDTVIGGRP